MKNLLKYIAIILLALSSVKSFADEVSFSKGTYQEILDMAKQQNKVIMIDFVTDWCKWCVETDKKVYTNSDVALFANDHQINWKIDAEKGEGPDLAKKYGVKGYPTIVFAGADGVEIDRIYGYLPAEQFLAKMKDYNNGVNTYGAIKKLIDENPDDPTANYLMGDKILSNGLEGDAKMYFENVIKLDPSNEKGYTDDAKFTLAYMNEDPVALKALLTEYPSSEKVKDGYINLASYYADKEDYKTAEQFFEDAFAKYGKSDFDLKQNYGGFLLTKAGKIAKDEKATDNDRDDAIKTLEKCLEYVGGTVNEASAYYLLSDLYFQKKNFEKANECIDKSLAIFDRKLYRDQKEKINKQEAKQ